MKKFVLLAMATLMLLSSCQVLSLLGLGGDEDTDQVELRLHLNGGTGTTATVQKFDPGQTATTPPKPTGWIYTGFQFTGWNTAADGQGDAFLPGDPIMMLSSITLYAQWRALGHPYSITQLEDRLNGMTARMMVFVHDYPIVDIMAADGPPDDILAFGYAVITNRNLAGNLWTYEGWIDNPEPDDPNMLPWQPASGIDYDVYIMVEFDGSAPELVAGASSDLGTSTINTLKPSTAYFNGDMTSWALATTTITTPNVTYLKLDQGHSYSITGFDSEWNGEQAILMVFPGDLDLAATVSSEEDPTLAAMGLGTISSGTLTGGLFQAPLWEDIDDPNEIDQRLWFPATGETYQVFVMLPNWQMVFFGEGTYMPTGEDDLNPPVVHALATDLGRDTGVWGASMDTAIGIDMDSHSGLKYKVSGFDSQYTDQTAIMLVLESGVNWVEVMNSEGPPTGVMAFGWSWIDEDGTVLGGLYTMYEGLWDTFGTGDPNQDTWTPWYPDIALDYEIVMILPVADLAFFGAGSNVDTEPPVINALALMDGEEPRWRVSASNAVSVDMGSGGDQDPLVLTSIAGIYSESRTVIGMPSITNENGILDLSDTSHAVMDGTMAMKVVYNLPVYEGEGSFPWLHIDYGRPCDITALDYLNFSLDPSECPDFYGLQIIFWSGVDGATFSSVQLSNYTATTISTPYSTYQIPLVDLDAQGLDQQNLYGFKIGGPHDSEGVQIAGTVYFDDIYFE